MARPKSGDQSKAVPNSKALGAVNAAKRAIGIPYVWGGTNLKLGVDCSGLCWAAYRSQGVNIPRTSSEQYKIGTPVKKGTEIPGDLVFSYPHELPAPGHVVMAIGNGKCIAAPFTGALVRIENLSDFDSEYVGSKRILPAAAGGTTPVANSGNSGGGSSALSSIGSAVNTITDTHTYYRVGQFMLGLALLVAGILIITKQSPISVGKKLGAAAAVAA